MRHLPDPGPERGTDPDAPPPVLLWTADGVPVAARHDPPGYGGPGPGPGSDRTAFVVVHGFTGHSLRPAIRAVAGVLRGYGGVVTLDLRGHGGSGGASEVGNGEVHDLAAAVGWARDLGYRRVVTVGFSLGAAVVVQHAARIGGVDAVVAVSGPSRWYFRGTRPMRLLHHAVEQPAGRWFLRAWFRTRVDPRRWDPVPDPPDVAIRRITVPVLVVHGDADHYFPAEHGRRLAEAAGGRAELWLEPGYGHAENAATPDLVHRIAGWAVGPVRGLADTRRSGRMPP